MQGAGTAGPGGDLGTVKDRPIDGTTEGSRVHHLASSGIPLSVLNGGTLSLINMTGEVDCTDWSVRLLQFQEIFSRTCANAISDSPGLVTVSQFDLPGAV